MQTVKAPASIGDTSTPAGNRAGLVDADRLVPAVLRRPARPTFWFAVVWLVVVVFVAVFADVLPFLSYDLIVEDLRPRLSPRWSWTEPLGTDYLGRSVLSRLAFGARQTLIIGVASTLLAMSIGAILGIAGGYLRGKFDTVLAAVVDSMLAMPPLVLLLAIAAVGRRGAMTVVIGLGVLGIPYFTRLARANTLSRAQREYIMAARGMGARHTRVVFRELLPDVMMPVSSAGFLFLANVVVAEATLSFLGLGVPPPKPTWGGMIRDGSQFLDAAPLLVFVPSLCIFLTVVALTIIGDHARRKFDVRGSALD